MYTKRYCRQDSFRTVATGAGVLLIVLASTAFPCSTPVFRYAMERWMADYYDGVLISRGEVPDDDPAALLLQNEQAEFVNLRLSKINLNDEQSWKRLLEGPPDSNASSEAATPASVLKSRLGVEIPDKLPSLVLWYPWHKGRALPFWEGEFTPSKIKALMDSPKRRELARRLTDGQTAVWVLVQSGNARKDKAALELINHEFEAAAEQLKAAAAEFPPEPGTPPFTYEFSTLTVSRSDPNEQMLLAMLLHSEPDLDQYAAEPIVFPVFGRGRVLFALVGEGINSDNLQEAIAFITGPCGCEIKMMNPGVDLLMAVNWDASVMKYYEEFYEGQQEQLPELTSVFPEDEPVVSPAATEVIAKTDEGASRGGGGRAIDEGGQPRPEEISGSADDDSSSVSRLSSLDSDVENPASKSVEDVVSTEDRRSGPPKRGFNVIGTTAASVGAIVLIVAVGTFVVTRRHP
ncbi:MAG: hypothetical protein P8Z79_10095 [Sedimentisphaerales bacterium]|jgi:hypothetical protein